jgi:mono/diheme cytochrome c family protein
MKTIKNSCLSATCAMWAAGAATVVSAQDGTLLEHMHDHYDAVVKIQSAVIAGSLEDARESARWLAEHQSPAGLPAGWEEHVDAMRTAARDTLDAQDLASAASATSRLGLACGGCHVANNVTVEFDGVKRPSDNEHARSHMQRHHWAADRMWEGLIGPSDVSWSRGANLLFESPMNPAAMGAEAGDDELIGMSRRIHQLAANATAVSDPIERAGIYAEFLENCAACHNALGKGPRR